MNGDVLTKLNFKDLLDFHNQHNSCATLCVREHKIDIPFGVVEYHETSLTGFKEKPSLVFKVNAGIYVVSPDMLSYLPADQYVDIPTFFEIIQERGHNVSVCPIHEYWIDIGRKETLDQANRDWTHSDN